MEVCDGRRLRRGWGPSPDPDPRTARGARREPRAGGSPDGRFRFKSSGAVTRRDVSTTRPHPPHIWSTLISVVGVGVSRQCRVRDVSTPQTDDTHRWGGFTDDVHPRPGPERDVGGTGTQCLRVWCRGPTRDPTMTRTETRGTETRGMRGV